MSSQEHVVMRGGRQLRSMPVLLCVMLINRSAKEAYNNGGAFRRFSFSIQSLQFSFSFFHV